MFASKRLQAIDIELAALRTAQEFKKRQKLFPLCKVWIQALWLHRRAAGDEFFDHMGRKQSGHFADHSQDETLIAFGESGAVLLDLREEANFILREFAQSLLRFAVAGRLGARKKVG